MKRYVVLGVNENRVYQYYIPLVLWAWKKFDWNAVLFYAGDPGFLRVVLRDHMDVLSYCVSQQNGYSTATLSQVSRLYGACVTEHHSYMMTSDVDMLPLSGNIFHYEGHRILSIGRDLTDYHYPICYIGGYNQNWRDLMDIDHNDFNALIRRDIRHQNNMWGLDQDILTEHILDFGLSNVNHISRGTDQRTGYPIGRVDRSHWTLDHKVLIDAHLPHDILTNEKSFHNVMELLHTVWPKEDFKWFLTYHREFKKLL